MANVYQNKHVKAVRVYTESMAVDGLLTLGLMGRALDELNQAARAFLPLASPEVVFGDFELAPLPLAINKESILFLVELHNVGTKPAPPAPRYAGPERRQFPRSSLHLRVGSYNIQGYVHTIEGGDPLGRLYESGRRFLALTAATVGGSGAEFSVPFLAVNRSHILAVQETFKIRAVMEDPIATASSDPAP